MSRRREIQLEKPVLFALIICTPLGALCRCAAYDQLLDVLHIVQATGIKQALFPSKY